MTIVNDLKLEDSETCRRPRAVGRHNSLQVSNRQPEVALFESHTTHHLNQEQSRVARSLARGLSLLRCLACSLGLESSDAWKHGAIDRERRTVDSVTNG